MSEEEKMEAWQYIPASTTGGAQSFDELIIKLQNGELQGEANRIRNSLMDEPAFVATLADTPSDQPADAATRLPKKAPI